MILRLGVAAARGLLELIHPERCVFCGAGRLEVPWPDRERLSAGIARGDGPHVCRSCEPRLAVRPVTGAVDLPVGWGGPVPTSVPLWAGRVTDADLVAALAAWKYHGVRGLAGPLGRLAGAAAAAAIVGVGPVTTLVPVPLHGHRRRRRGFNQAEVLARRVAEGCAGATVAPALVRRVRATAQQAGLTAEEARRRNVKDAFRARRPPEPGEPLRVGVVDDLVTSGATAGATAAALLAAGWDVAWIVAAGAAAARLTAAPDAHLTPSQLPSSIELG